MPAKKPLLRKKVSKITTIPVAKLNLGDDVRIEWQDAVARTGWSDNAEARLPLDNIISSGFVIAKEKDRVTLAGCVDVNSGNVSRIHSIPVGGITSIRIVEGTCVSNDFWCRSDAESESLAKFKGK